MLILRRASLVQKSTAACLIGLSLLTAALLFLYQTTLSYYADGQAQRRLRFGGKCRLGRSEKRSDQFHVVDGKLLAGQIELNGRDELVDHIKELVGGVATIFMGDMRVATNVKKSDGSRAVGTKLAAGPAYDAIFKRGESYRGKADILGQSYFTAYDPIKSPDGATIGILFVGVLEAETHAAIAEIGRYALAASFLITLAIGSAILFLSRWMFSPLVKLRAAMAKISKGDLNEPTPYTDRLDDIGEMARAVQVFRTNTIENERVEREAAENRAAAESERELAKAERARAAEELASALQALADGLERLSRGDLTVRLDDGFSRRYAKIRDDFNGAAEKLRETLRAVVASASAIQSNTREISDASNSLSERTEQQAAGLEETAAALDEITATVKKSAEGAKHASQVVANADDDAKKGAVVVKQAVEAMNAISKSSEQIGQIIGVIDEIAFQTNLLALNAGVEAARAGDAGKGFAVVASEVRALAQRSAEAAKEIKNLISTSAAQVGSGVKLVAETGQALGRILAQVSEINRVVAEIAAGAQEQASGLQQVNTAINQMDQSTQQNATMVEESTTVGHSLSKETSRLANLIGQFKVDEATTPQLRDELKKVAPHVFAAPPEPPPHPMAKSAIESRVRAPSESDLQRRRRGASNARNEF